MSLSHLSVLSLSLLQWSIYLLFTEFLLTGIRCWADWFTVLHQTFSSLICKHAHKFICPTKHLPDELHSSASFALQIKDKVETRLDKKIYLWWFCTMPPSPPPSCAAAAASRRWRCFVNNVHWHLCGLLLSRGSDPPGFQLNHLITPGRGQTIIRIVPEAIVYQDSSSTISSWHTVSNLLLQNINHKSFTNIWSVIVETRLCAAELVWFEVFCQSKIEFIRFFYNMNQNYGFKKRKNTENDFPFTTLTYFYKVLLLLFLYLTISTTWGRSIQLSVISHELHQMEFVQFSQNYDASSTKNTDM